MEYYARAIEMYSKMAEKVAIIDKIQEKRRKEQLQKSIRILINVDNIKNEIGTDKYYKNEFVLDLCPTPPTNGDSREY